MGYYLKNHYPPSTILKMIELAALLYMEETGSAHVRVEVDKEKQTIRIGEMEWGFEELIGE